jgi:hypothetical protein
MDKLPQLVKKKFDEGEWRECRGNEGAVQTEVGNDFGG